MNKETLNRKVFVVPAHKDLIVRHPHTKKPIPEDGLFVEDSPYIRRRLRDGDLVLGNPRKRKPADIKSEEIKKEEADE
jgi:hypothetical protein